MGNRKYLFVLFFLSALNVTQAYEDLDNVEVFEDDLIQTEAIMNETEAALRQSEDLQQELKAERRSAEQQMLAAKKQRESAQQTKSQAIAQIAANEKRIERIQQDIAKARKDIVAAQKSQADYQARLTKSKAKVTLAEQQKAKVMGELAVEKVRLEKVSQQLAVTQTQAEDAAKQAEQTKKTLTNIRLKVRKQVEQRHKTFRDHKRMIESYRKQLAGTFKELDRLDLMLEIDHEYDLKRKKHLRGKGLANDSENTISGLNVNRQGIVTAASCQLREFPDKSAKVVGHYGKGHKLNMTHHQGQWMATVYSGQKAFIDQSCVSNQG